MVPQHTSSVCQPQRLIKGNFISSSVTCGKKKDVWHAVEVRPSRESAVSDMSLDVELQVGEVLDSHVFLVWSKGEEFSVSVTFLR